MVHVTVLLDEVFQDLCAVFVAFGELKQGQRDSLLEDLVAAVAHEHNQLCGEVHTILERDFQSNRLLLKEVVDGLGIGLEVIDLIGRKSWWFLHLLYTGEQLGKRNDDCRSEDSLDVLDVDGLGHVVSHSQETIILLRDNLQGFHHVVSCGFSKILFFQQFDQFDKNSRVYFSFCVVNALFLTKQINRGKHDQTHRVSHL